MDSHFMELPRAVLVGNGIIGGTGEFLIRLCNLRKVLIVSDEFIRRRYGNIIEESLGACQIEYDWNIIKTADFSNLEQANKKITELDVEVIIGMGGGASIDVAKLSAHRNRKTFISLPTNAAHDGIASPFASIKDSGKPYSIVSSSPLGLLADLQIISSAPPKYARSGCGDLISKITAVKDWQLARDERGEYYGEYAANLALLSAQVILKNSNRIGANLIESTRDIVEALISAGVAAGIAGSSRPCSGAEHLFSHALDIIAPGKGLHGEKCGIGTILMAKLHDLDWEKIKEALEKIGTPTSLLSLGITKKEAIEALMLAPKLRDRFTILHKCKLSSEDAARLIELTRIA
ncbi:MAG: sn-glycerol-1-phosphate dehydrogenase [Nitrososphaeria archaeon]